MNWYYVDAAGQQAGPVDDATLDALAANGTINPETLVWKDGMPNWEPLGQARAASSKPAFAPPPVVAAVASPQKAEPVASGIEEAVCDKCGNIFPIKQTIRKGNLRICNQCNSPGSPSTQKAVGTAAPVPTGLGDWKYAGFWIRVLAKLLDGLIMGFILFIIGVLLAAALAVGSSGGKLNLAAILAFQVLIVGAVLLVPVLYTGFFTGKCGATLGKMAFKLQVVQADGSDVGYGRAFGRAFAEILSGAIFYIGYIITAFDKQKRALHDHICATRVIHKPAED